MSVIGGIFDLKVTEEAEKQMILTMNPRGKGEIGVYRGRELCLMQGKSGQRGRLTEMRIGGRKLILSWDGRLFNAPEIARDLGWSASELQGATPEELILLGYAQWGEELAEHLEGNYALMIFDEEERKLFLLRDRMGVKPLFYKRHQGGLLAASEMKTILSYPTVVGELDARGAGQILLLGPGKILGSGVFYDIGELEPGQCGTYHGGNLRLRAYWKLKDRPHEDDFETTGEIVRSLIENAMKNHTCPDENIGTMLSGGLDSGIVSAICNRRLREQGRKLATFSVDYEDNEKNFVPNFFQPNMDRDFIEIMHRYLQSDHHQTVLSPQQLVDEIAEATVARDLPGMADVDTSLLCFCRQIKPFTDRVLSGECADEIFGGYPWYRDPQMRDVQTFPWSQNVELRAEFLHPWILEQIDPREFVRDAYQQEIQRADILPGTDRLNRRIKELVCLNFRYFMQTLIDRGDRLGARAGVEIRMPLCDHHIAEYLYTVPWEMKDHGGQEKGLLRSAVRDLLPEPILYRKKSPYPKTYDPRYLELVSRMLAAVLEDKNAPIFQLVRRQALEDLLHRDFDRPWYGQLMRRPQTIAFMLQINFWMEHYSVRIR